MCVFYKKINKNKQKNIKKNHMNLVIYQKKNLTRLGRRKNNIVELGQQLKSHISTKEKHIKIVASSLI